MVGEMMRLYLWSDLASRHERYLILQQIDSLLFSVLMIRSTPFRSNKIERGRFTTKDSNHTSVYRDNTAPNVSYKLIMELK